MRIDADAVIARLHILADTEPCQRCEIPLTRAIADIGRLLIEVTRLHQEIADTRLEAANLRAAIRAALGAAADGEADPLAYLRDELSETDTGYSGRVGGWGR